MAQTIAMARQLAKILDYAEFRNSSPVIEKAKKACQNSGQPIERRYALWISEIEVWR